MEKLLGEDSSTKMPRKDGSLNNEVGHNSGDTEAMHISDNNHVSCKQSSGL